MTTTERFLKYVAVDTNSLPGIEKVPSTDKQFDLANILADELREMGAEDVEVSEYCYVYATIPATTDKEVPTLGFIAHMDTIPEISGKDVKARIVKNYDGKDILLNEEQDIWLRTETFPFMSRYIGEDLVVTDGTTLLGADDKAGIAEIMAMADYLLKNPQIKHGKIKIGFTPDEEVGHGPNKFDVEGFGADLAYTLDGGPIGSLNYETFNAASGTVKVTGLSVHPGSAKNQMKNAALLAVEFASMLPANETPATTEVYEGFYHLTSMNGGIEDATLEYIIRDHDMAKFNKRKETFLKTAEYLNFKYGEGTFEASVEDSYFNMKEMILPHPELIENVRKVFTEFGVEMVIEPVRGGTDGARLSFMGLPCPNLSTGGVNFHSRFEFISVESLEKMSELLVKIAEDVTVK